VPRRLPTPLLPPLTLLLPLLLPRRHPH